jgi:hypothetical protein
MAVSEQETGKNKEEAHRAGALIDHIFRKIIQARVDIDSGSVVKNHHGERGKESQTVERWERFGLPQCRSWEFRNIFVDNCRL